MRDGEMMSEDEFEALVAAYGALPARWPEDRRAAAQARALTDTPRVRAALAEAEALDRLLDQVETPTLSAEALDALRADARPSLAARLRGLLGWSGPTWQPVGALAAALLLGIGLGVADPGGATNLAAIFSSDVVETESELDDPFVGEAL